MTSTAFPPSLDHKPTVLIVDDEPSPRAALTHVLRHDFNILTAEDVRTAMTVLKECRVDLVTLDLRLPDGSGTELLDDIKRTHAEVEVIMVTGFGTLTTAMDCIRHGAAGFLLKPFNASELLSISLQTCRKKQRLDMLRTALKDNRGLRGPDPACAEAWSDLARRYAAFLEKLPRASAKSEEPASLVQLVSDLLEAKDRYLVNHGNRVSFYASLVASRLELPLDEQNILSIGALAHDLDLILSEARLVLQQESSKSFHRTDRGATIGRALGLPADSVQIIALHHERWDGTGYPFGLEGERIPLLARLVAIAQAFDDLTAERPGSTALAIKDAIAQIEQQAGSAFDPMLAEVFCRTMREQPPQQ